jgi:hypothetical protein
MIQLGSHLRLKGAKEVADERMFAAEGEDLPLDEGALDVVVLKDLILLQALDRVKRMIAVSQLGQNHLKVSSFDSVIA